MNSTLVAHDKRFESKLVTFEQLSMLEAPQPMGLRHKPVAHATLVEAIHNEMERRDLVPVKTQYALARNQGALFGVIDLKRKDDSLIDGERGMSFGFRSSTNQALSIKAVAGTRVFVCDNLALSGSMIALQRKSTIHLDLKDAIAVGFDKFVKHEEQLDIQIEVLKVHELTDGAAKEKIFDVFDKGIVPVRLFDDVSRFYFKPEEDQTDVQPRSLWGLHNAFTRALKEVTPTRAFEATVQLGREFGMGRVIDGEVV